MSLELYLAGFLWLKSCPILVFIAWNKPIAQGLEKKKLERSKLFIIKTFLYIWKKKLRSVFIQRQIYIKNDNFFLKRIMVSTGQTLQLLFLYVANTIKLKMIKK